MKKLIFIATLLAFNTTFAKSLECSDAPSFTGRDFSINRDGSIGFDGTYIVMRSDSGKWGASSYPTLDDITGRGEDAGFILKELTLAISPKAACTNPEGDVHQPFKCATQNATIIATGFANKDGGGIWDKITIRSQLKGEVEVELLPVTSVYAELVLRGKVTVQGRETEFEIPVRSVQNHCKVTTR